MPARCPTCKAVVSTEAAFCPRCGQPIQSNGPRPNPRHTAQATFHPAEPGTSAGERLRRGLGLAGSLPTHHQGTNIELPKSVFGVVFVGAVLFGMILGGLMGVVARSVSTRTGYVRAQDMVGEWDIRESPSRIRIEPDAEHRLRVVAIAGEPVDRADSTFLAVEPTAPRTLSGWRIAFRGGRQMTKHKLTIAFTDDLKVCSMTTADPDASPREPPARTILSRRR